MNYSFTSTFYMGDINLSKWAEAEGGGELARVVLQGSHGHQGSWSHKAETAFAETRRGDRGVGGGRP